MTLNQRFVILIIDEPSELKQIPSILMGIAAFRLAAIIRIDILMYYQLPINLKSKVRSIFNFEVKL